MNAIPELMQASDTLTIANHWDHFLARWGYRRGDRPLSPVSPALAPHAHHFLANDSGENLSIAAKLQILYASLYFETLENRILS